MTTPGTLYNPSTGIVATPTANVTPAQTAAAQSSGFLPYSGAGSAGGGNTGGGGSSPYSFNPVTGAYIAPATPTPTVDTTIDASKVGTVKPLAITPTTSLSDINSFAHSLVTENQPAPTAVENTRTSLESTLAGLVNTDATKSTRFDQLNQQYKVPTMVNQLNDLNLQIAQRKNAFTQLSVDAEGKAIPTPFIVGEQTQIQRQAAVELGALASVAQAVQGNIQLANDTIDRTLKMEFEPIENQITQTKTLLDLNYQDLSRQEKKQADATQALLTRQQGMLDDLKSAKRDAFSAVINSAADPSVRSQAAVALTKASTPDEAYQIGLQFGGPKPDTQVVSVGGNQVLISSRDGHTIKVIGPTGVAPLSPTGDNKALNDAFNQAVVGMPATQLPTVQARYNNLVLSGDIDGAKNYLVRVALSSLPLDQQNQAIGRKNAISALSDIRNLLDQAQSQGAGSGLVAGKTQQVAEKLGQSGNQNLAYIGNQIAQALQVYRKSMTGVAFGGNEAAEYAKIFPDITNVNELNTTKINSLIDTFDRNNRNVLGYAIGDSNYDKLFGKKAAPLLPSDKENPFSQSLTSTSPTDASTTSIYDKVNGVFNIPTH